MSDNINVENDPNGSSRVEKLNKKKLDMLFANNATETFGSDVVSSTAISEDENIVIKPGKKSAVARHMLKIIANKLSLSC